MRPTPNETVAGIVRILRDTVSPAVVDAHALARLTQVIAVLRAFEAEDAAVHVRNRAAELDRLLDACAAWALDDPARTSLSAGVAAALGGRPVGDPSDRVLGGTESFATVNERCEGARRHLAAFIAELTVWRLAHGTDDSDEIMRRIGTVLAGGAAPGTARS